MGDERKPPFLRLGTLCARSGVDYLRCYGAYWKLCKWADQCAPDGVLRLEQAELESLTGAAADAGMILRFLTDARVLVPNDGGMFADATLRIFDWEEGAREEGREREEGRGAREGRGEEETGRHGKNPAAVQLGRMPKAPRPSSLAPRPSPSLFVSETVAEGNAEYTVNRVPTPPAVHHEKAGARGEGLGARGAPGASASASRAGPSASGSASQALRSASQQQTNVAVVVKDKQTSVVASKDSLGSVLSSVERDLRISKALAKCWKGTAMNCAELLDAWKFHLGQRPVSEYEIHKLLGLCIAAEHVDLKSTRERYVAGMTRNNLPPPDEDLRRGGKVWESVA